MFQTATGIVPGMCGHCGLIHGGPCPRVKAIEYHLNGTVKRVEYHDSRPSESGSPPPRLLGQ